MGINLDTGEQQRRAAPNLLELKPERRQEWEHDLLTGFAVILIPRFQGKILGKILQPRLKKPHHKISLDEYGTTVWECCDGNTTVNEIARVLQKKFGDKIEPLTDRLALFMRQLEQQSLIRFPKRQPLASSSKK